MTRSAPILLILFLTSEVYSQSPSQTLDKLCPCDEKAHCSVVFGSKGESGLSDILKFIPQCPTGQVRCCTKDAMFQAIMLIVSGNTPTKSAEETADDSATAVAFAVPAGATQVIADSSEAADEDSEEDEDDLSLDSLLDADLDTDADEDKSFFDALDTDSPPKVKSKASGKVECIPASSCSTDNIYGTDPDHFTLYGFISPSEVQCFANSGDILCVVDSDAPSATGSAVHVHEAASGPGTHVHGSASAAAIDTLDDLLDDDYAVDVAVAAAPAAAAAPLPCSSVDQCSVVYGTSGEHFTLYGIQPACSVEDEVRCVTLATQTTPEEPDLFTPDYSTPDYTSPDYSSTDTTHHTHPTHPTHPPHATGVPTVQIIGPQPIYVTYNHIKGPTVGGYGGLEEPGTVESHGVDASQESQINLLLTSLKTRLRQLLKL